jgi:hypothetical protein
LKEAWGKCQWLRNTNHPRLIETQQALEIYAPADPMGRPGTLDEIMGTWDLENTVTGLPAVPNWFLGGMCLPLELAPGLITGFLIAGIKHGSIRWKLVSVPKTEIGGIGLGGLPAVVNDGLLLLNDPQDLLAMAWHWSKDTRDQLPAVCAPLYGQYPQLKDGCSELVAATLAQYKTLCMLPEPQAYRVCSDLLPGAYTGWSPAPDEIHNVFRCFGSIGALRALQRTAQPWAEVARKRLMCGSIPEAAKWIYDVRLPQTPKMLSALVQEATPAESRRIADLFDSSAPS